MLAGGTAFGSRFAAWTGGAVELAGGRFSPDEAAEWGAGARQAARRRRRRSPKKAPNAKRASPARSNVHPLAEPALRRRVPCLLEELAAPRPPFGALGGLLLDKLRLTVQEADRAFQDQL